MKLKIIKKKLRSVKIVGAVEGFHIFCLWWNFVRAFQKDKVKVCVDKINNFDKFCGIYSSKVIVQPLFHGESLNVKLLTSEESKNVSRTSFLLFLILYTAWKVSKYGVFSGPNFLYFRIFTVYIVNVYILTLSHSLS